jgi:hypothetical protein
MWMCRFLQNDAIAVIKERQENEMMKEEDKLMKEFICEKARIKKRRILTQIKVKKSSRRNEKTTEKNQKNYS